MGEGKTLHVLSERGEEIVRAVHFYRYMTALDVAHLVYAPSSLTRVRGVLATMCGGGDFIGGEYLYRFSVPSMLGGNPERVYILGSRGREFLESEGVSVRWYFRPEMAKRVSLTQVRHNLALTRVLIGARKWGTMQTGFRLEETRICYGMSAVTIDMNEGERREKVSVIPDAWLLFEKLGKGKAPVEFPVLVEIDRGTMYRERFKKHVLSRIEFIRSGEYKQMFGKEAVLIAYATIGAKGEATEGRRSALCRWTMEALQDAGRESWARSFRFHSLSMSEIYSKPPFAGKVWYRPDQKSPGGIFDG